MRGIRGDRLTKKYGRGETEVVALRDAALQVREGEVAALLGPSGSGKTTLLMILGFLTLPDAGDVFLDDEPIVAAGRTKADLAAIRRLRMGFVFQKSNLVPFLNVVENVILPLDLAGRRGPPARSRAHELLEYLGMADRASSFPEELSGGQQQRVAIARALAVGPSVILADEPSASLDGMRTRDVMSLLRKVASDYGTTVLVVTHDSRTLGFFDSVYEMEDGVVKPVRHPPQVVDTGYPLRI